MSDWGKQGTNGRRLLGAFALALAITSCGAAQVGPTHPQTSFPPDNEPTSGPTFAPWPAAFAESFCIAVGQNAIFGEDLEALRTAAEDGDLDAVELHASSTGADVDTIDLALERAPAWKPAAATVAAWRKALAAFRPALSDLEKGAAKANGALVRRGAKRLESAAGLLDEAVPKLTAFVHQTGFGC